MVTLDIYCSSLVTSLSKPIDFCLIIRRYMKKSNSVASQTPSNLPLNLFTIFRKGLLKIRSLCLSLIYPAFFVFYLSLSRYLRLGSTVDIYSYLQNVNTDIFAVAIFLILIALPNLFIWFKLIVDFIKELRETLWILTCTNAHYLHIKCLQYKVYFYITQSIYKLHFILFDIFITGTGATFIKRHEALLLFRMTPLLYYKSWIILVFCISSIILELILCNGKMYYGIYILFIYPLSMGILCCFNEFGFSNFVNDVCMSDYIYQRYLHSKPRYLQQFLIKLNNPEYYYGFTRNLPEDKGHQAMNTSAMLALQFDNKIEYRRRNLQYRIHGIKTTFIKKTSTITYTIMGQPRKYNVRIAGLYYSKKHVRWFSTTRVLHGPDVYCSLDKKYHSNPSFKDIKMTRVYSIGHTTHGNPKNPETKLRTFPLSIKDLDGEPKMMSLVITKPLPANALNESINMQRTSYVQTPKITYRLIRYRTMTHRKHKTEFLRPKREKKSMFLGT
jgi:hypothetical protein